PTLRPHPNPGPSYRVNRSPGFFLSAGRWTVIPPASRPVSQSPPLPDKKSRIRSESAYARTNRAVTPPVSTFFEMNHRILPTRHSHKQRDHLRK
ncbi:hypothetical protein, partial [Burkholderia sp. LMG 13014]|uniref:hypothetical protein n=1 Tax=Burkholderia sp. LMG 13014 TaxID=2709306 RepID=UPI001965A870